MLRRDRINRWCYKVVDYDAYYNHCKLSEPASADSDVDAGRKSAESTAVDSYSDEPKKSAQASQTGAGLSDQKEAKGATSKGPTPAKPLFSRIKFLFLDLDDVLIQRKTDSSFKDRFRVQGSIDSFLISLRPHLDTFIKEMLRHYRVYVFTSSGPEYANNIYKLLPHSVALRGCFSRESCTQVGNVNYKIPRFTVPMDVEEELRSTLLVDDDPFYAEPAYRDNVVTAEKYLDFETDDYLLKITPLLVALAQVDSIQTTLREWKEEWKTKGVVREAIEFE
ncbi:HAD-like domain-containing protein [Zopfochytrium polystomum]|nr:HAD-like domain-containing protein [Zopfochytrium polystomum]